MEDHDEDSQLQAPEPSTPGQRQIQAVASRSVSIAQQPDTVRHHGSEDHQESISRNEDVQRDLADSFHSLLMAVQGANLEDSQEALRARAACIEHRRILLAREQEFLTEMLEEFENARRDRHTSGAETQNDDEEVEAWQCDASMDMIKEEILDLDSKMLDEDSFTCALASETGVVLMQTPLSDLDSFTDPFALLESDAPVTAVTCIGMLQDRRTLVAYAEQDSTEVCLRKVTEEGDDSRGKDLSMNCPVSALDSHLFKVAVACKGLVKVWHLDPAASVNNLAHPDLDVLSVRFPVPNLVVSLAVSNTNASAHGGAAESFVTFWDLRQASHCLRQVSAPAANGGGVFFDAIAGGPERYAAGAISEEGVLEAWDVRQTLRSLCKRQVIAPCSDLSLTSMSLGVDSSIALGYAASNGSNMGKVMIGHLPDLRFKAAVGYGPAVRKLKWATSTFSSHLIVGELSGLLSCMCRRGARSCQAVDVDVRQPSDS